MDPLTFIERGESAWELLDARAIVTLDQLRDKFGPLTVNTWHTNESHPTRGFKYRGFRPWTCPEGAKFSQHKYGRAFDCSSRRVTAEEMRQYILEHHDDFPFINCLELDVDWLHFDTRNVTQRIKLVRP